VYGKFPGIFFRKVNDNTEIVGFQRIKSILWRKKAKRKEKLIMNKKHFYVAVILLLFLAIGIKPARAIEIPTDTSVGTWDGYTYTLTTDVSERLVIVQSNMILDGVGHEVTGTGPGSGTGISLTGRTIVTIRNLTVTGFDTGISLGLTSSCNVTGNNVLNNYANGIYLQDSSDNTITDNKVSDDNNSGTGIKLYGCSDTTLIDNTASGNYIGISLHPCSTTPLSENNILTGNTASSNTLEGILISNSNGTILTNNKVYTNYWGIHLLNSDSTELNGNNTLTGNAGGIWLEASDDNTLTDNNVTNNDASGIYLSVQSDYNTLTGNVASNNEYGIKLKNSSNNTLTGNTTDGNTNAGIWIDPSNNNTFTDNDISNNNQGIYILNSNDNQIYNNNFIENATHAEVVDGTGNLFNLDPPIGGNYWSGWEGPAPYVFTGGQDDYPWADPDGWLMPDTTPPEITCPGDIPVEAMGPDGVPVDDERIQTFLAGASATDNCDPPEDIIIINNAPTLFPPGDTPVTFTATDTSGNSSTCQSTVTVVEAAEGHLRIIPRIINREGRLEKILAVIRFPEGTTEEDIDIAQPLILYPGDSLDGVEAINQRIVTWYRWGTLRVSMFASFSKDEVTAAVPENGPVELMVIGRFIDGQYFYGLDNVWIISWDW